MYIYGGAGAQLERVSQASLKKLSLHVFEGAFSCCALKHVGCTRCDKQELALPMLGLYSLVLKRRHEAHMAEIAQMIENDKNRFFPSHIDFIHGTQGELSERRPLLDELVETMEAFMSPGGDTAAEMAHAIVDEAAPVLRSSQVDNGKVGKTSKKAGKKSRVYALDDEEQA